MTNLAIHGAGGGERYTKSKILEPVRLAMGGIDLDPCSCPVADRLVQAGAFYTKADDGLKRDWINRDRTPARVWVNPPSTKHGFIDGEGRRHHEPCVWWLKTLAEIGARRVRCAAFLIFNAETFRHMATYNAPHPADGRILWLYDRPSFLDADGGEILDAKTGKQQSPAHLGAIALLGTFANLDALSPLGRITGRV